MFFRFAAVVGYRSLVSRYIKEGHSPFKESFRDKAFNEWYSPWAAALQLGDVTMLEIMAKDPSKKIMNKPPVKGVYKGISQFLLQQLMDA